MRFKSHLHLPLLLLCAAIALLSTFAEPSTAWSEKNKKPVQIGTRQAATALLTGNIPPKWIARAGGTATPKSLAWPIPGRRLGRGFGSDNGRHLAVDITAPVGTKVHAMAQGMVGYAGEEVKGYGKLMLVVHPGGWVTLYAHLSAFKARAGQLLSRGQIIALSGNTGISKGPHLHTALIINGKPADPIPYMRNVPLRNVASLFPFGRLL